MSERWARLLATEQMRYWQVEREKARHAHDAERIERCERFIAQCEVMISALERTDRSTWL